MTAEPLVPEDAHMITARRARGRDVTKLLEHPDVRFGMWTFVATMVLLIWVGGVWFLQGINVLPGSFMTGQIRWAIIGSVTAIGGVALLVYANRPRGSVPPAAGR